MDGSRIFITGANGQLGTALRAKYPEAKYADIIKLDITNEDSVANFDWQGIDILINAAAFTNVDGAETDEGRRATWSVNASALENLSRIANENDITLVHVSTDYVFDGSIKIHKEDEAFSPLSVYGASKAAGDIAVSLANKHYILRTSWLIGEGKNFVRTMAGLAQKNISPTVVHDQVGRLTFTSELVKVIDHLLSRHSPFGTYNVSNEGKSASWADITRKIFQLLGRDDLEITNTTTAKYFAGKENIAPRPLQSTLDLSKIQATGFTSTDWENDLEKYLKGENS